ncbi:hypothetical protein [Leptospira sp. P2653]|uniref:hypothetical protein n=1 Tax=Leptospira sp. P2653 TaxID=1218600 RepID=UPI0002BF0846|nr:hypothetical protein [Leptospira sp. P2653]EMJ64175.1 hypothetical protein LEP1GSC051_3690 [Leptospira sp. P2653]
MKTSYIYALRTSLSLEEICEQIRNTLSISNIQILESNAVLRSDEFEIEIELNWTPFNPMRENYRNLHTKLNESKYDPEYLIYNKWLKILKTFEMDVQIRRLEDYYYFYSKASLAKFCKRVEMEFNCGPFDFDYENDNEWAIAETDDFTFHISRAYKKYNIREYNVPPGCNYIVNFTVKDTADSNYDHNWYNAVGSARWEKILGDLSCKSVVNKRENPIH